MKTFYNLIFGILKMSVLAWYLFDGVLSTFSLLGSFGYVQEPSSCKQLQYRGAYMLNPLPP